MRLIFLLPLFLCLAAFSQHQDKVDFLHAEVTVSPDFIHKSIDGSVFYTFKILNDVDSIWLDAKNMKFFEIRLDGKIAKTHYDDKKLTVKKRLMKGSTHHLFLKYACSPKQAVYFVGLEDDNPENDQIWTQGQGKYTSHWLPSFDDMEEKVEFDLSINTQADYQVIANGKLMEKDGDNWKFDMEKPISSYLLAFTIGIYGKEELTSASGVSIENYFYPKDSLKVEPTYRYTKEIFDFLEDEIGVNYPWQNYKQIPVHDFLYAGMENTGTTIFSDAYVIDSIAFIDRNYVNINAHELAHQWFGDLVTEKNGNHHWLHEGFATYYAYLSEKEIFGKDHFYWKLYDTAKQLEEISEDGKGESLLDPSASSLTFYEKGAWALVMLRDRIGEETFKKGIKLYLEKYAYKNVRVEDFLNEMENASGKNLGAFKSTWLESVSFPWEEVRDYLKNKNKSIATYFYVQDKMDSEMVLGDEKLMWLWNRETPIPFKTHLISAFYDQIPDSSIQKIFENKPSLEVRQALAVSLPQVEKGLKADYESLLRDKSYLTQEYVLFKLWEAFPENRAKYLDLLENVVGLPNKNVRLLWLTLALVTPDYNVPEKPDYLFELIAYTHASYNPEVRQGAFQYLYQINAINHEVLKQLILATDHHSWQFRTYVRNMLDEMLKDENLKQQIVTVATQLKPSDLRYLKTKIDLP